MSNPAAQIAVALTKMAVDMDPNADNVVPTRNQIIEGAQATIHELDDKLRTYNSMCWWHRFLDRSYRKKLEAQIYHLLELILECLCPTDPIAYHKMNFIEMYCLAMSGMGVIPRRKDNVPIVQIYTKDWMYAAAESSKGWRVNPYPKKSVRIKDMQHNYKFLIGEQLVVE